MDHKTYLAAVPPARRKTLTARSNRRGLVHLAGHLAALGSVGCLIAIGVPGWPVLMVVQGLLVIALFMLTHECTHQTPFRSARLNEIVGQCAGFVILIPFRWFRYFHLAHHKWTNITGKDPELGQDKPETIPSYLWHVSGVPVWRKLGQLWWRLARGTETADWLPARGQIRAVREARVMLAIYGALGVVTWVYPLLVWVWLVPLVLGQPFLRLYLLAEHGDCARVANMFDNTRTTYTHSALRWLTWNMPFHTEHHVWPDVPFHQLPELHQDMQTHLHHTADGYTAFNRSYLARRLQPAAQTDTPDATG